MFNVHVISSRRNTINLRSHVVEKAIQKYEDIRVTCDAQKGQAVYTTQELANPVVKHGPYISKHDGKKYFLYTYYWKK